jgi:hypothetical protein
MVPLERELGLRQAGHDLVGEIPAEALRERGAAGGVEEQRAGEFAAADARTTPCVGDHAVLAAVQERASDAVPFDPDVAPRPVDDTQIAGDPPSFRARAHTVRSASVGESRAARRAGSKPAIAPIAIAAPMPPAQAVAGMTTAQPFAPA